MPRKKEGEASIEGVKVVNGAAGGGADGPVVPSLPAPPTATAPPLTECERVLLAISMGLYAIDAIYAGDRDAALQHVWALVRHVVDVEVGRIRLK